MSKLAVLFVGFFLVHAETKRDLAKECFEQKRGRSCVQLGNTLWQTQATRGEALRAFNKGCELKEESACTLKNLKPGPVKAEAKKSSIPKGAVVSNGDGTYTIKRSVALEMVQDLSEVFESATLEQDKDKSGKVQGYRFKEIDAGSVFELMGFHVGDVVTQVNGKPMTSASEASALIPSLMYESEYVVTVIRDGKNRRHVYKIA